MRAHLRGRDEASAKRNKQRLSGLHYENSIDSHSSSYEYRPSTHSHSRLAKSTRQGSMDLPSQFANRLHEILARPSTAPARQRPHQSNKHRESMARPGLPLTDFQSSIANVTPSWKLATLQRKKSGKPIKFDVSKPKKVVDNLFWTPSKPIDVYCIEQTAFRSLDSWARTKILETKEQANGKLNSVTTRHACDILLRVTRRKLNVIIGDESTRELIIAILEAVFNGEIASAAHNTDYTVGGNYVRSNCYYQDHGNLKRLEAIEMMRVPEIEKYMEKEQKDLVGCRNALLTSTRNWQLTIKGVIFRRWRDGLLAANVAAKRFREFIKKMLDPNLKPFIVGWRNVLRNDVEYQTRKEIIVLERNIKYAEQQLRILSDKARIAGTKMEMYRSQAAKLLLEIEISETVLEEPGRSPPQLKLTSDTLCKSLIVGWTHFATEHSYIIKDEILRIDKNSSCMNMIMPQEGTEEKESYDEAFEQAEALEHCDDDVDVVFPFELLSGIKLSFWIDHLCRAYSNKFNLNVGNIPKLITSGEDLQDGKIFGYIAQLLMPVQWKDQEDLEARREGIDLFKIIKKTSENHDEEADKMCRMVLRCFQSLSPPIGKFIKVHEMIGEEPEEKESSLLAPIDKDKQVSHRMVSMYQGQSIDVEDDSEQLQFNFLVQILQMIGGVQPPLQKYEVLDSSINSVEGNFRVVDYLNGFIEREKFHTVVDDDGNEIISEEEKQEQALIQKMMEDEKHRKTMIENMISGVSAEESGGAEAAEGDAPQEGENGGEGSDSEPEEAAVKYIRMDMVELKDRFEETSLHLNHSLKILSDMSQKTWLERRAWTFYRNDACRLGWRSMCHTLLAQRVAVEEHIDDGQFTGVSRLQLSDALENAGDTTVEAQDDSIKEIQEELKENLAILQQIFTHYCTGASSGSNESMDRGEYWRFIRDIKVKHKRKLTSPDLDLIFTAANVDRDDNDDDDREEHSQELLPIEFSECLVRIAVARFDQGPVIMRLKTLFEKHVLKYACATNKNTFKRRIETDNVYRVFSKFRKPLKVVFKAYARADQKDDAINKKDTINYSELVLLCRNLGILRPGSTISEVAVQKMFALVQDNTDEAFLDVSSPPASPQKRKVGVDPEMEEQFPLDSDEVNKAATLIQGNWRIKQAKKTVQVKRKQKEDEQTELSWPEFLEVLSALSCYVHSDPYKTMEDKIETFIIENIIIPASKSDKGAMFDDKSLRLIAAYVPRAESPPPEVGGSPRKIGGSPKKMGSPSRKSPSKRR